MITSAFGPPFDNQEWEDRKEQIKQIIANGPFYHRGEVYHTALRDLWVALEAEESDNAMLAFHTSYIYDVASGGLISKPNTLPHEVEAIYYERLQKEREEAYQEGRNEGQSDLLYEHFGGTLPR